MSTFGQGATLQALQTYFSKKDVYFLERKYTKCNHSAVMINEIRVVSGKQMPLKRDHLSETDSLRKTRERKMKCKESRKGEERREAR